MTFCTALELNVLQNSYRPATQTSLPFSVKSMIQPSSIGFPDLSHYKQSGLFFTLYDQYLSWKSHFFHIHRPPAQKYRPLTQQFVFCKQLHSFGYWLFSHLTESFPSGSTCQRLSMQKDLPYPPPHGAIFLVPVNCYRPVTQNSVHKPPSYSTIY